MRVAVTGAAGFIGSNFVYYALSNRPDWKITALDLLTYSGNLANLAPLLDSKKIEFKKIDIADAGQVDPAFEVGFDLVIHFAAESHVDRSIHSPSEFVRTNVLGTQNLINAARNTGVKRFVHVSTDEVYGSLGPTGRFYETTPLAPSSPYSASKAGSDLMVLAACHTYGFDAVVTRCTNNYGPYQFPEKLIPLFITNALEGKKLPLYGDGLNVRSWLYVDDHCEAVILAAERGRSGEVYNIGGDEKSEIPNIAVTKTLLQMMNQSENLIEWVKDRPAHDRRYAVDTSKIRAELGWAQRVPFSAGLERTLKWYQENESWWRGIKSGEYLKFYKLNYEARG